MRTLTHTLRLTLGGMLALAVVAGCAPKLDDVTLVKDLRILALQAEPPEIVFDDEPAEAFDPVKINALVHDPRAPYKELDWELWGCDAQKIHCGKASYKQKLTAGRTAPAQIRYNLATSLELYRAALDADPFKGRGGTAVMVELRILDPQGNILDRAVKRVVYSQLGLGIPLDRVANNNPRIHYLKAADAHAVNGGGEIRWVVYAPGQVVQARVGRALTLLPRVSDPDHYVVAVLTPPFNPPFRNLIEYHSNHYFTTNGKMGHAVTGGQPQNFVVNKKQQEISSDWIPAKVGPARLWIVVRDNRGGAGWISYDAYVSPPPDGGYEAGAYEAGAADAGPVALAGADGL